MKTVFDYIVNLDDLKIQPNDVLLEVFKIEDSNIILTDEAKKISEGNNIYAQVIKVGKDVDGEYCTPGDIVLVVGGSRIISWEYKERQYALSPIHNISLTTPLPNFKIVKNASASLQKNK